MACGALFRPWATRLRESLPAASAAFTLPGCIGGVACKAATPLIGDVLAVTAQHLRDQVLMLPCCCAAAAARPFRLLWACTCLVLPGAGDGCRGCCRLDSCESVGTSASVCAAEVMIEAAVMISVHSDCTYGGYGRSLLRSLLYSLVAQPRQTVFHTAWLHSVARSLVAVLRWQHPLQHCNLASVRVREGTADLEWEVQG